MPEKKLVDVKGAKVFGPYSPALIWGNLVFVSGQIPIDNKASIEEQTKQVLEKIKVQVEAAGCTMDDILQCTVFLGTMDDFAEMNKVYETYFNKPYPTRMAVEARIYNDFKVEIAAIVGKND